jgi:nucleoside-diphosphate-sugar epimerase
MIFEAANNKGVAATILQPSIVYGPFCMPWTNMPAEMLLAGDVILPDQGEGLCNAVYIDDVVDSLVLAALAPSAIGQRFIISGPRPLTWAAFFTEMAKPLKANPPKCWPQEKIREQNRGSIQFLRRVVANPKQLIRMLIRWKPARRFLQDALDSMPSQLRMAISKYYFDTEKRPSGEIF